ncbi:MAG: type-F conjugative transfer system secretin TraK [Deltaproteobacteria bacterium]|nr:type-F conjugative transfer system secretin TraK [Deltaproteobacteria bacterium]MCX7953110.1 type-F conjugative transfer system secretin TraK [Deltaproteobacteria bacterium]
MIVRCIIRVTALALSLAIFARELEYSSGEIEIYVLPGEATQVQFPDDVLGGYKKQGSLISVDKVGTDLIIFAQDKIVPEGEVILVRTKDNRSYSLRIKPAPDAKSRDDIVIVKDQRPRTALSDEDELPKYRDRQFIYPSQYQVAGLMREMVLATEFGKPAIPGYKVSDAGAGSVVVNNGQLHAKLVKMYLGPQLWGYVLEAENVTDETVKIDPSVFKINGTRAISLNKWELSPKPITTEQRYSEAHKAFVYIVAKAR